MTIENIIWIAFGAIVFAFAVGIIIFIIIASNQRQKHRRRYSPAPKEQYEPQPVDQRSLPWYRRNDYSEGLNTFLYFIAGLTPVLVRLVTFSGTSYLEACLIVMPIAIGIMMWAIWNEYHGSQIRLRTELDELKSTLMAMCGGDRELVKRLVDFERSVPGKPEEQYWRWAIHRLERDRR